MAFATAEAIRLVWGSECESQAIDRLRAVAQKWNVF
jgi:hypothetical protein